MSRVATSHVNCTVTDEDKLRGTVKKDLWRGQVSGPWQTGVSCECGPVCLHGRRLDQRQGEGQPNPQQPGENKHKITLSQATGSSLE